MFKRLLQFPQKSFFLLGPRGTGKSTWLKQHDFALKIDLLRSRERLEYERDPSILHERVAKLKRGDWVLIDEVQKIPALLDEVHSIYEDKKINFALSGSSARKLKRSGANLLAGRALNYRMFPLVFPEYESGLIKADFKFQDLIDWGTLPLILSAPDHRAETLEAYIDNYLRQELIEEGIVRKMDPFSRFLYVAGQMNGQILNVESIAREAKVKRPSVDNYFEVLADTLLGFRLRAYQPGLRVNEVTHPKFYFFDSGVARAAAGLTRDEIDDAYRGFLFETFILNEVSCYNEYLGKKRDLFYYALRSGGDIDLIIQLQKRNQTRSDRVIAIEIKLGKKIRSEWLDFLIRFDSDQKNTTAQRKIIVYNGTTSETRHGIDILPVELFLTELYQGKIY
jgi:predicted AAA+ superfamily ATPase